MTSHSIHSELQAFVRFASIHVEQGADFHQSKILRYDGLLSSSPLVYPT